VAPGKGRRFNMHNNKPVWTLPSPPRAPFTSFDIKHNPETRNTYLALINRNAQLTVYENEEPESLDSWQEVDSVNVCPKPARGEETSFKVSFDPNIEPCYNAVRQGVQKDSLAVVVASMNKVTIWRTKEISHAVTLGASTSKEFYLAAELKGHRGLVRDVAWAPGSIRGFDIIATACKDGFVRVFEVTTPSKGNKDSRRSKDYAKLPEQLVVRASEQGARHSPSGIGAGLAGARPTTSRQQEPEGKQGEIFHAVKEVSKLDSNKTPVWKVEFDEDGQLLGSTGDDGKLLLCRREPSGVWSRSAELALNRSSLT
jgi:nucleoporin SEH1